MDFRWFISGNRLSNKNYLNKVPASGTKYAKVINQIQVALSIFGITNSYCLEASVQKNPLNHFSKKKNNNNLPRYLLQYCLVTPCLTCDVINSSTPLEMTAEPRTIRKTITTVATFRNLVPLSMKRYSTVEPTSGFRWIIWNMSHGFTSSPCLLISKTIKEFS